jgi:ribonuclease P/MRP protein subunit RPP40
LKCGALFCDLSAAFDKLDTELLVKKLEVLGAAGNMTTWVRSYLTGQRQRVDWDGCSSKMIDIIVGSPQGSVISPLLFLIMDCNLKECLSEGSAVTFVDDTTCYAMAPTHEEVRRLLVGSEEEILPANPEKTQCMMFGRGQEEAITVGDVQVSESTEGVLLGITFNKSLSWKNNLDKLESELRKRVSILRRMTWQLPRDLVIKMIEPIFSAKL